jgi:hypothetical protein
VVRLGVSTSISRSARRAPPHESHTVVEPTSVLRRQIGVSSTAPTPSGMQHRNHVDYVLAHTMHHHIRKAGNDQKPDPFDSRTARHRQDHEPVDRSLDAPDDTRCGLWLELRDVAMDIFKVAQRANLAEPHFVSRSKTARTSASLA